MSQRPKRAAAPLAQPPQVKPRITTDLDKVCEQLEHLVELRGRSVLTREERLDVLHVYFAVTRDGLMQQKKTGRKITVNAFEKTASLLGRSKSTVATVVKEWTDALHNGQDETVVNSVVDTVSNRGNRNQKVARIPHTKKTFLQVREHVREKRLKRERITGRQVLDFLVDKRILEIEMDPSGIIASKSLQSGLRATQRYLLRKGFCRGQKTGKIVVNPDHIAQRNFYIRTLLANRAKPEEERRVEVYLDESYIHQHYHRHENSVYDPNDEQDLVLRTPHKGRRYCILAAIENRFRDARLVPGSVWTFCPQAKEAHQGDYHKNFNGQNFATWWKEQLLPNLDKPSLIIMDNAAYHKTKPPDTPKPVTMKKAEVLAKLEELGIEFDRNISAIEARALLRNWVDTNVESEVVAAAERLGHKVIFTPPHYSDLQPIELVWALIKGNVGRQYTHGTTLKEVKARLDAEFDKLESMPGQTTIKKIIDSVDKHLEKFAVEIDAEEKVEEEEISDGDVEELVEFMEELELGNIDTSAAAQNI